MTGTQDLLYLVLAIAAVWLTAFLCWALYELATLLRRSNRIVEDVECKIAHLNEAVTNFKERVEQLMGYAGFFVEGGKAVMSLLHRDKDDEEKECPSKSKRSKKGGLFDEE